MDVFIWIFGSPPHLYTGTLIKNTVLNLLLDKYDKATVKT